MSATTTTVIEQCKVSPPAKDGGDDHEFTLPMVFFDMLWYTFPVSKSLFFFEIPNCSRSHFLDTIVPCLKGSLSLAIKRFLPFAGHIVHPTNPADKPVLRYSPSDAISFTVAESKSGDNFSYLTGKHPRESVDFYSLVPELPPETETADSVMFPVHAIRVTLFPGSGVSLGTVSHHAVVDATTISMFLRAWACLNRSPEESIVHDNDEVIEARLEECGCLPFYDRKTVADIDGLDSFFWESLAGCKPVPPPPVALPTERVRASFVLRKEQVEMLKSYVGGRRPDLTRLSSYAVTCGFVWMCSSRSHANAEEADEPEVWTFGADCRERLNPPLPRNYFGNCVALAKAELKHGDLIGDNGFVSAVEAIGNAVRDRVYAKDGILSKARDWDDEFLRDLEGVKRVYGVSGSTRFDVYSVDFRW